MLDAIHSSREYMHWREKSSTYSRRESQRNSRNVDGRALVPGFGYSSAIFFVELVGMQLG